jgi:hypothetical protein
MEEWLNYVHAIWTVLRYYTNIYLEKYVRTASLQTENPKRQDHYNPYFTKFLVTKSKGSTLLIAKPTTVHDLELLPSTFLPPNLFPFDNLNVNLPFPSCSSKRPNSERFSPSKFYMHGLSFPFRRYITYVVIKASLNARRNKYRKFREQSVGKVQDTQDRLQ